MTLEDIKLETEREVAYKAAYKKGRNKMLRGIFIGILGGCVLAISSSFYQHHNVYYKNKDEEYASKMDGLMNHTELHIENDGPIEIRRSSLLSTSRHYYDNDGDHEVDRLFEFSAGRGGYGEAFYRDEDLKDYSEKFVMADRDFKKQMERFQPFLDKRRRN